MFTFSPLAASLPAVPVPPEAPLPEGRGASSGSVVQQLAGPSSTLATRSSPPCLRKANTLSGRIELVHNVVTEIFSGNEGSNSPFSLRKATSDPSRAFSTRPPYQMKPEHQLDAPQNVHAKSFVKKLYAQFPGNPFMQKLSEKTATDVFMFKRKNHTHPQIAFPQKLALESHAQKYSEKYDISIHLASLETLRPLMQNILRTGPKPSFVSFIVAETEDELQRGHVAPVLCSLGTNHLECLIMDVLGGKGQFPKKLRACLREFTPKKFIITAEGNRQFDSYSCRTGALSLLRNAHLSLRFHNVREGLIEPLKTLLQVSEIDLDDTPLPSEWTYVEQAFHGRGDVPVIRDFFSSKIEKKQHPRPVEVFRHQHTEETRFVCTLENGKDYRADFVGLVPPPNVQVKMSETGFELTFEVRMPTNTYLLKKGFIRGGLEKKF